MVQLPVELMCTIGSYLSVYDVISLVKTNKSVNESMRERLEEIKRQRYKLIDRKFYILRATEANPTDEMLGFYMEYQAEYNLIDSQIETLMRASNYELWVRVERMKINNEQRSSNMYDYFFLLLIWYDMVN